MPCHLRQGQLSNCMQPAKFGVASLRMKRADTLQGEVTIAAELFHNLPLNV